MLKTLTKANIKGKRILLRVAYDITLENKNGAWDVPDDQRIKATIPTIKYLLNKGCPIVLLSWLGRPDPDHIEEKFKMDPVARRLSKLIDIPVKKLNQTVGEEVDYELKNMKPGDIIMLENTRFNKGEKEADPILAKEMSKLGEFVVYDAFAQSHRIHASTTGILENHKDTCCAGFLMEKELDVFDKILAGEIDKPFIVILGGSKISDKVPVIRNIITKADSILIGGALANTFFKANNINIGGSLVEGSFVNQAKGSFEDPVKTALDLLNKSKELKCNLHLPVDVVVAKKEGDGYNESSITVRSVKYGDILCDKNESILDIGPRTYEIYNEAIQTAKTIFWNGPMGLFEDKNFETGTREIAESISKSNAYSIVGGGDTESVVVRFDLEGKFNHVSTGGGASLELLAGQELPVLKYLEE